MRLLSKFLHHILLGGFGWRTVLLSPELVDLVPRGGLNAAKLLGKSIDGLHGVALVGLDHSLHTSERSDSFKSAGPRSPLQTVPSQQSGLDQTSSPQSDVAVQRRLPSDFPDPAVARRCSATNCLFG